MFIDTAASEQELRAAMERSVNTFMVISEFGAERVYCFFMPWKDRIVVPEKILYLTGFRRFWDVSTGLRLLFLEVNVNKEQANDQK